jgi:DNA-binding CsgD family transcriptional regulator
MVVPSSNKQESGTSYLADLRHMLLTPDDDTFVELLSYIEDMIVFLHHFNEDTSVHEIKALFASFEQKAEHQFCFLFYQASKRVCLPSDTHSHFSLQFRKMVYGTLCVRKQVRQPDTPAFPLRLAHSLAGFCGWLLYTCEQSMFVWSYQQPAVSMGGTLTKREREVLNLMCHGYGLQDIAWILNITPATVTKHKQHIYNQLGVHTMRDALHVSYHCGLISFLDELYEWRNN